MNISNISFKLTELTDDVVGLQRRQPSAGRRLLMMSIIADMDELKDRLANDVLTKVNREIVAVRGHSLAALKYLIQNNSALTSHLPIQTGLLS